MSAMARAATTTDAFNAVAEPRRRQILDVLAGGERPVSELVEALGWRSRRFRSICGCFGRWGRSRCGTRGRRRLYRLNGEALKPIHDWVSGFERTWTERFGLLDGVLEDLERQERGAGGDDG